MSEDVLGYFADKIEREAGFYEQRAKLINPEYTTRVRKYSERFADQELRRWVRETVDPNRIACRVHQVRFFLQVSRLVDADREIEALRNEINHVDAQLKRPFFKLGADQYAALERRRNGGNAKRKAAADAKHQVWLAKARGFWKTNANLTASSCARKVISTLRLTESKSTVRRIIGVANPKKVGKAS